MGICQKPRVASAGRSHRGFSPSTLPPLPHVSIEVGNACQVSSRAAKRKCLTPTPVHKHVHYVAILSSPKHTHTHTHTHAGRKMKNRVQVEEERGAFLGLVFLGKLAAN